MPEVEPTPLATPDWLKRRQGDLQRGLNERTYLVLLNGKPVYKLVAVPAAGKHTCAITLTVSGKRVDQGRHYDTIEAALQGGLDELREQLGW